MVPKLKISTDHDFITTDYQVQESFKYHYDNEQEKEWSKFNFGLVTSQESDIPTKILKLNADYFAEYFYKNI